MDQSCRLKTSCNYHRMGMIPGSSTVEHLALTNLKTVESAPLIPRKIRFYGPSLEPTEPKQLGGSTAPRSTISKTRRCAATRVGMPGQPLESAILRLTE